MFGDWINSVHINKCTNYIMNKDIIKLQKEIERLQNIALEQFEEKRIPNDKNHKRLMKLKKQLERLQKEGEH